VEPTLWKKYIYKTLSSFIFPLALGAAWSG
jgi:hypothetical protein